MTVARSDLQTFKHHLKGTWQLRRLVLSLIWLPRMANQRFHRTFHGTNGVQSWHILAWKHSNLASLANQNEANWERVKLLGGTEESPSSRLIMWYFFQMRVTEQAANPALCKRLLSRLANNAVVINCIVHLLRKIPVSAKISLALNNSVSIVNITNFIRAREHCKLGCVLRNSVCYF